MGGDHLVHTTLYAHEIFTFSNFGQMRKKSAYGMKIG